MKRRHFLGLSLLVTSAATLDLFAKQTTKQKHTLYPYGRFGAGRNAGTAQSAIEKPVSDTDDEWAKVDLIAGGTDEMRLREAVSFGAYASYVDQWRVADSLLLLRNQINSLAPNRSRSEDGFIGDAAHRSRNSDHNPWVLDGGIGVVTAFDVTHDQAGGCDANAIVRSLVSSKDKRIKYIIWQRRIINSERVGNAASWTWRSYGGPSPHDHHLHLSILPSKVLFDAVSTWTVSV